MRHPPKVKPYYYTVTIYITLPESHLPAPRNQERIVMRPNPPLRRYNFAQVNEVIQRTAQKITATYPKWRFRMVRVLPDVVRFIYDGEREHDEQT